MSDFLEVLLELILMPFEPLFDKKIEEAGEKIDRIKSKKLRGFFSFLLYFTVCLLAFGILFLFIVLSKRWA